MHSLCLLILFLTHFIMVSTRFQNPQQMTKLELIRLFGNSDKYLQKRLVVRNVFEKRQMICKYHLVTWYVFIRENSSIQLFGMSSSSLELSKYFKHPRYSLNYDAIALISGFWQKMCCLFRLSSMSWLLFSCLLPLYLLFKSHGCYGTTYKDKLHIFIHRREKITSVSMHHSYIACSFFGRETLSMVLAKTKIGFRDLGARIEASSSLKPKLSAGNK